MKRLYLVVAVAAVVLLVVAVFALYPGPVEYEADGWVVAGHWGAGDGEFGRRVAAGGEWFGPLAFAVHPRGEWVAIADTHNERVIITQPDRHRHVIALDSGPLAVAVADGAVIVLAGESLLAINPATVQVRSFDLPSLEPERDARRISMDLSSSPFGAVLTETVLFPDALRRRQFAISPGGVPVLASLGELTVGSDGSRSIVGEVGSSVAVGRDGMIMDSPAGEGLRELRQKGWTAVVACSPATKTAAIVGADSRGRTYVEFELLNGDRELARFDRVGRADVTPARWTITVPPQPVTVARLFQIDLAGRIYVATANDEGYRIVRHRPVRR